MTDAKLREVSMRSRSYGPLNSKYLWFVPSQRASLDVGADVNPLSLQVDTMQNSDQGLVKIYPRNRTSIGPGGLVVRLPGALRSVWAPDRFVRGANPTGVTTFLAEDRKALLGVLGFFSVALSSVNINEILFYLLC